MTAPRLGAALCRVLLLAVLPLKRVPLLDDLWDGVQIVLVLAAMGGSTLIGTNVAQLLSGGGGTMSPQFAVVAFSVLVLVAPVKLQLFKDGTEEAERRRLPLTVASISTDARENGHFLRLVVHNPNLSAVEGCFVELVGWDAPATNRTDRPAPPAGFRFPRSSWSGGGLVFPIAAKGDAVVDVVFWIPGQGDIFYTPHIASDPERPVRPSHPLNPGHHRASLRFGTDHDRIPSSQATIQMDLAPGNLSGRLAAEASVSEVR